MMEVGRPAGEVAHDFNNQLTTIAPDLGRLEADPGLLEQVTVNLIVEARDTIGGAGCISVETARWSAAAATALTPLSLPRDGRYALLVVTGSSPDAAVAPGSRGLDPVAGMTPRGERSGIGLVAVRGIVEQLGGQLAVEARPGKRTVFRVWLPAFDQERQAVAGEAPGAGLPRGTETLLLVEDEPAVRELEVCVLREQGYRVLEAADGQEALEMLQGPLDPVPDLLVTDLAMPRLGGRALADLARGIHPQMRILCISGDAGEVETTDELPVTATALLHKPFTIEELTGRIREALEGSPG